MGIGRSREHQPLAGINPTGTGASPSRTAENQGALAPLTKSLPRKKRSAPAAQQWRRRHEQACEACDAPADAR